MSIIVRYASTNVVLNNKKKRVYATTMYPTIVPDPSDLYVEVNVSDRLDILAHTYYGDARYWWIIAQANNLGKGSMSVGEGQIIRLPQNLSKIVDDYERLNKNR